MYYQPENDFKPEEVLDYLRKSRTACSLFCVIYVMDCDEHVVFDMYNIRGFRELFFSRGK